MEEKNKKVSVENIYEDLSTLKLKQHKIIFKKKEVSKKMEINYYTRSDNIRQATHWDILLTLDIHEETKWKKGFASVISNQISTKVKKSNRKKKLDELYRRCMCLYLSMNINNNLTDISLGNENKNMTEQLNTYIKTISNVDYLSTQFTSWKKTLSEIKSKLEKTFSAQKWKKANSFFKVLNLMEDMIKMQEETIKYFSELKERKDSMDVDMSDSLTGKTVQNNGEKNNLSNFIADIDDEMNNNQRFNHSANHHLYTEYLENTFNKLDLNKISKDINDVIEEIVNEINSVNEDEILLNSEGAIIANSSNKGIRKYSFIPLASSPNSPRTRSENDIIFNINPKQLFYDYKSSTGNEAELKFYLERLLKMDRDKIEIMPKYNYKKISGTLIDLNKEIDEYTLSFMKIFPPIYFSDKTVLDKKMLESEIDKYRVKHEKVLGESELLNLFNLKFNNFTAIQKLILIWGICNFGMNLNILSEIPNIFTFSKSLPYDTEEIFVYLDKTLDSLNVDLLASNFDSLNLGVNSLHTKSDHYINNYEPPMLNSTHCNFAYNKILYDFVNNFESKSMNYNCSTYTAANCNFGNGTKVLANDTQITKGFKSISNASINKPQNRKSIQSSTSTNCLITSSSPQMHQHYNSLGINLIYYCPVLKTSDMKKFMFKSLKEGVRKVCDLVNELYNSNNTYYYNYQTMTRNNKSGKKAISTAVVSPNSNTLTNNPLQTTQSQNNNLINLNKADLLQQLTMTKIDFSANEISKHVLDETKPVLSKEILEGVSFYSQNSINKEWEYLRNPWYQNNIQFKPKFRKTNKIANVPQIPNAYPNNIAVAGGTNASTMNFIRNLNDNRI